MLVPAGALAACWPPLDELSRPSVSAGGYREVVLADEPLAYWRLEETTGPTAHDETKNHNDAAYSTAGITFAERGALAEGGSGVRLDGRSGKIVVGNLFDFPGLAHFAIEAWIWPTRLDASYRRVFQTLDMPQEVKRRKVETKYAGKYDARALLGVWK